MSKIKDVDQTALSRIKKNVERAGLFFQKNYERFRSFQKFTFKTNLESADESTLEAMGKPIVQFNITYAYVARQCGEFAKHEPSIEVRAAEGAQVNSQVIEVVEGHIRHIIANAKKQNAQYMVYRDQMTGGFGLYEVMTEYANDMSLDQVICLKRNDNPTMVGFDPMAKLRDKSDAEYYFKLHPIYKETFKKENPGIETDDLTFALNIEGFKWVYESAGNDVVVQCEYYEKEKKKKTIVKIANNQTMLKEKYEEYVKKWNESGELAQPPAIVSERQTMIDSIKRYTFVGNKIIKIEETDFKLNSIIFADGDSVELKDNESGNLEQFTKPYIYHAKDIQRGMNFAGQTILDYIENMMQHKIMAAIEGLPQQDKYLEAYTNLQKANVLGYQAFFNDDPDKPVPPPREIALVPLPPEVTNFFMNAPQIMQHILGSYDAQLGINDNQLSGVAIIEGATQSNATAMPYVVSHMQALNQAAQVIIDLIPKYYSTPRTIPILDKEGRRSYQVINDPNDPNSMPFNYDDNALLVTVEAGVNSTIAKNKALQQIIALMQADPKFAEFMQSEGLEILLDNVEFRGSDVLKSKAIEWMKKQQQAQAQAAQQPNPQVMMAQAKQAEIQHKMQQSQVDSQLEMMNQKLKAMEMQQRAESEKIRALVDIKRSNTELEVHRLDSAREHHQGLVKAHEQTLKHEDQQHRHMKESIELHHKMNQDNKPKGEK